MIGIPCPHAIACINWLGRDSDDYVDNYMRRTTYLRAHDCLMKPLNGRRMWEKVQCEAVLPPIVRRRARRPKNKRERDALEKEAHAIVPSKNEGEIKCTKCIPYRHNRRTCKVKGRAPKQASAQVSSISYD